jgi:sorbitol-6-phosphate 2-dehydrogenase
MGKRRLMILGASSGIGRDVFDRFRDGELSPYGSIAAYGLEDFDISNEGKLTECLRKERPTDVIYSIGINKLSWIRSLDQGNFNRLMEVNVWGFLSLVRLLDLLSLGEKRNIVAVTSDAAWRPMRTSAVYCASKAALEMAVRVASREYAPRGWRINAVAPGKVADTGMTDYVDSVVPILRGWTPEFAAEYERNSSPLGRAVTKSEVTDVILSVLNGPAAQTGEIVAVNGGR